VPKACAGRGELVLRFDLGGILFADLQVVQFDLHQTEVQNFLPGRDRS